MIPARGKSLAESKKKQIDIFQGNVLSPLLFKIEMMSLHRIFGRCSDIYEPTNSPENINHQM